MRAVVIGSTGLVGENLLQLLERDARFTNVLAFVRTVPKNVFTKVKFVPFNFNDIHESVLEGDVLFCALGTTLKKAGSKAAQFKVDYEYNLNVAKAAKIKGFKALAHVSSLGANSNTANFYLKTKGDLEKALQELEFEKTIIVRPSIILGDRKEFRLGEKIGIFVIKFFTPLLIGPLKKYRGVSAKNIAQCMINKVFENSTKKVIIVESDSINKD